MLILVIVTIIRGNHMSYCCALLCCSSSYTVQLLSTMQIKRNFKCLFKPQTCLFRYFNTLITTLAKDHLGNHPTASCKATEICCYCRTTL